MNINEYKILKRIIEQSIKKNYRIVTNGIKFRIERYEVVGKLWWRKKKWVPVSYYIGTDPVPRTNFMFRDKAESFLNRLMLEDASEIYGWHIIKNQKEI